MPTAKELRRHDTKRSVKDDFGDHDGIATSGRGSRLGACLDRECGVLRRLRRNAQPLNGRCPVFQRTAEKGRAIRKGPRHLGDPAILAVALGTAGRVHLGVSIHQTDLDDGGSGRKLKRDHLAYAIAVASPRGIHFPVNHVFRHVVDRTAGAIGGLRRLATDLPPESASAIATSPGLRCV